MSVWEKFLMQERKLYEDALLVWDIQIVLNEDKYCAYRKSTFNGFEKSIVGFGNTVRDAIEDLLRLEKYLIECIVMEIAMNANI